MTHFCLAESCESGCEQGNCSRIACLVQHQRYVAHDLLTMPSCTEDGRNMVSVYGRELLSQS